MTISSNTEENSEVLEPKYKRLIVKIESPLNNAESILLNKIQKKFSKNGFQMEIREFEIVLLLHSIDLEAFKTYIHSLLSTIRPGFCR